MSPELGEDSFDFSKYVVDSSKGYIPDQKRSEVSDDSFFDFNQYKVREPETNLQAFGRHTARTGARVAETVVGFPGDVINFVKFIGSKLPDIPDPFMKNREPSYIQQGAQKLSEYIPTSEQLKDVSSYLTSGFTDPKGAAEELGDEITSLATVLINPSRAASGFTSLLKNIGSSVAKSTAAKGSGKAAELLGADDKTKAGVELGTLFLTGLLGAKTANKFIGEQYEKAKSLIPPGQVIPTRGLETALNAVEKELSKGITTPTKSEVTKSLGELKAKASGGAMEVEEIVQSYHDINEKLNSKKLFDELNTSERILLKKRYDLVKDEVSKEIESYGRNNPEFLKLWRSANQGYATIAQSKKVGRFLESKLQKIPHHLAGSIAMDLFLQRPTVTAALAGGYGAVKTGELLYQVAKSPKLREHYMKVLMEASNENLTGVIKNLSALDKELK